MRQWNELLASFNINKDNVICKVYQLYDFMWNNYYVYIGVITINIYIFLYKSELLFTYYFQSLHLYLFLQPFLKEKIYNYDNLFIFKKLF